MCQRFDNIQRKINRLIFMILAIKINVYNKIISNYILNANNSNMIYSGNFFAN